MSAHSGQRRSGPDVAPRAPRLGRRVARFNRAVTNKVAIHVAGWAPGLGIVIHVGRRTRTVYRTPVNVFRTKDGFRFALTYGPDAEWVRNALAHGAVRLITRGKEYELTEPELVTDPHRQHVPASAAAIMRFMRGVAVPRLPPRRLTRPWWSAGMPRRPERPWGRAQTARRRMVVKPPREEDDGERGKEPGES